jgi:cell division protein FtsB
VNWKLQLAVGVLLLVLVGLQFRLWVGEGSLAEVATLRQQLAEQRAELADLHERNATLQAEVDDLKEGLAAIEARARSELGLIRQGETYFQLLPPAGGRND